jgi:hypothetical protein
LIIRSIIKYLTLTVIILLEPAYHGKARRPLTCLYKLLTVQHWFRKIMEKKCIDLVAIVADALRAHKGETAQGTSQSAQTTATIKYNTL